MSKKSEPLSIVFLDRDGLPERIAVPPPKVTHTWTNYAITSPEQVVERARHADILIVNKVAINSEILEACPNIKHIVVSATGYNVIDVEACQNQGVSVSNVPSYAATTVSEHVIGSALVLRREMRRYARNVANGEWQHSKAFCLFGQPFHDLNGATIGLVGLGEIGNATAQKAQAMGMQVLFTSRTKRKHSFAQQVELDNLLKRSDIISLHCSLNPSTHNLISERELALMQPHAILINTARGGIVDESAATKAIQQQQIAGLAFDVMVKEPPSDSAPLLAIANQANVLLTPHIAWASEEAMQYLVTVVSKNIDAFASGNPINLVT